MTAYTSTSSSSSARIFAPPVFPFHDVQYALDSDDDDDSSSTDSDRDENDSSAIVDLFAPHEFYALEHDLLLVKHLCFQSELTIDVVAQRFAHEFGVIRTTEQLEQRFATLQSSTFQALFALYLQAIALDKDGSSGTSAVLPAYQPLLRATRTSCETKLYRLLYDDEKLQSEATEMLRVEVAGRGFPKYIRSVSKTQLSRCAGAIHQLLKPQEAQVRVSRHQAFTLQGANTRVERLQLTDAVAFYDSCHVYNHLESPVFDRFVQFAKDPNVIERLKLLRQQLSESSVIKRESSEQLRAIFAAQHEQCTARLAAHRVAESNRMQLQLERVLEDDIQHIRRMHETLLCHEHAKIAAKYDEHVALLNEHLDAMRRAALMLQASCESSNGGSNLARDVLQTELQVERIFGASDTLVRLLILAEDLDAEPLRRALISYLSDPCRFPQFALRREMTSKMIPDTTVLEILKRCPTSDLRELETAGNRFLHHELVARELHTRRVAFGRLLASLPNDKLRATLLHVTSDSVSRGNIAAVGGDRSIDELVAGATDFPDVLEHELTRRRDFSCVKMNSERLERLVSFSEEDCLLQLEAPHRYCTVLATKERKQGESGKWMFEATIEVFGGDGESILLGWEVPRGSSANAATETAATNDAITRLSSTSTRSMPATSSASGAPSASSDSSAHSSTLVPGLAPSADGRSYGVMWQSDSGLDLGILHANGQSRSGVPCFRAGDVVACTINQDDAVPHLRFYLNGEQVLPSVSSSNTRSNSSASASTQRSAIHVQNPPASLFPALAMYSSNIKPLMRVRFNFRGHFAFPLSGFEPYGAPL